MQLTVPLFEYRRYTFNLYIDWTPGEAGAI